jgi:hypothetical protein
MPLGANAGSHKLKNLLYYPGNKREGTMLSPAEALRLEIDIARIAAECAAIKDPEQRARLQARVTALSEKRNSARRSSVSRSELQGDSGEKKMTVATQLF